MAKIIETFELTKYYKHRIIGVEDLSLSVEEGEIYGFLGSNGAGKTTTIRLLMNLLFPTRGKAAIFGKDVVKNHLDICRNIGYLPSSVIPPRYMTGEEFLSYMGNLSGGYSQEYSRSLLEKFEFSQKNLKRKIKEYSTGMARKIALVQTFQNQPRLVIMDEPTDGLDPVMQNTFYEIVKDFRSRGGTVLISSHHLLEVELICGRVAIIRNGKLAAEEKIRDLMKMMTRKIHVEFKNEIERSRLTLNDWDIVEVDNNHLTARITGDIDQVIKFLARFQVKDMSISTPNLQDVFMSYYQEGEK